MTTATAARPSGICPHCYTRARLRRDGTVGKHGYCDGDGKIPLTEAEFEALLESERRAVTEIYEASENMDRDWLN
jgi:hypothetical protein